MASNFPASAFLSARGHAALHSRLAELRIAGGAVYDALVGAAAVEDGRMLVSRDLRALPTYRALDVPVRLLPPIVRER